MDSKMTLSRSELARLLEELRVDYLARYMAGSQKADFGKTEFDRRFGEQIMTELKPKIDRITAALSALSDERGEDVAVTWMPIESAPSDTDVMLCWYSDWTKQWYYEVNKAHVTRAGTRHGDATHWQPLPKPPIAQAAGGQGKEGV